MARQHPSTAIVVPLHRREEPLPPSSRADPVVGGGTESVCSDHFSIAIGRALGTVVVTVHGDLDELGARHLGSVLADLIDGQGNLAVVVDLQDTVASENGDLSVFATAAAHARRHGGVLSLSDPPDALYRALALVGLDRFVPAACHAATRPSPPASLRPIAAPRGAVPSPATAAQVLPRLRAPIADPLDALTQQQRKILDLITDGMTNRQIGEEMFLAEKTVKNYVSHLLTKMGMERRSEAAAYAATLAERRRANQQTSTTP